MNLKVWIASLLIALSLSACAANDKKDAAAPKGNMALAKLQVEQGLKYMEQAFDSAKKKDAVRFFNKASNCFKTASDLYFKELSVASEARKPVIEEEIEKVERFRAKAHSNRPVEAPDEDENNF